MGKREADALNPDDVAYVERDFPVNSELKLGGCF